MLRGVISARGMLFRGRFLYVWGQTSFACSSFPAWWVGYVVGWLCVGNVGWLCVDYVCGVSAGVWTYTVQLLIMSQPKNHTL